MNLYPHYRLKYYPKWLLRKWKYLFLEFFSYLEEVWKPLLIILIFPLKIILFLTIYPIAELLLRIFFRIFYNNKLKELDNE